MEELKTFGFHHVTLVTGDIRRSVEFYRNLLGLRLFTQDVEPEDPGVEGVYLGADAGRPGTMLRLVERRGAGAGVWGQAGIHHVALGVRDEEALLRWKRRLTDFGASVSGPLDRGWFTSIYFRDPDGQILELATEGPGYALDEPADALGSRIIMPPAKQLRGNRDEAAIRARTHEDPVPDVTAAMALRGIHHVTGITDDIERAHRFYQEVLGLRRVKRSVNQDDPSMPHWFWARYDGAEVAPHSSMTLFGWPAFRRATRPGRGQVERVAFRVTDAAELERWRARLLDTGTEVSEVIDRGHSQCLHFQAPDGLPLSLATDGPGFVRGEPAARHRADPEPPAELDPERGAVASALPTTYERE